MIIQWTKDNVKIIPIRGEGISAIVGKVQLMPGMNEVDENLWAQARKNVKDEIELGIIKEIQANVTEKVEEVKDPKTEKVTKKVTVNISAKKLNQLTAVEAEEIVANCYNVKTLETWKKKASKDSVRTAIMNQIELIEKHGEVKAKAKNDADGEG